MQLKIQWQADRRGTNPPNGTGLFRASSHAQPLFKELLKALGQVHVGHIKVLLLLTKG